VERTARRPEATGLKIEIVRERDLCRVALRGELTFRTAGSTVRSLTKLLLNHDGVMVDLSRLRVGWAPSLQVFPTALASAGGWPFARLTLFGATTEVSAALHGVRVPTTVPLAQGARAARTLLKVRPNQVMRCYDLANDVSSPRRARALVRQACSDWDLAAVAGEAVLVASELVTNAVQHARTPSRLQIAVDEQGLHVAVQDFRPGRLPPLRPLADAGSCGAGLHVVAGVKRRWGVTPRTDGKRVWAVLGIGTG
jgi:anti-sigma regulatory factor (Ser/Thr protein kinase)